MSQEGDSRNLITFAELQSPTDFGATVTVLATSFQNAPNFVAAFPDAHARQRALPHILRLVVRDAGAFDGVSVARRNGEIIGAAVWYPPGRAKLTFWRQLQALPNLMRTFTAAPQPSLVLHGLGAN